MTKIEVFKKVIAGIVVVMAVYAWQPNAATASENGAIQTWKVAPHEALTPQALTTASQKEVAASQTLTLSASNGTEKSQEMRKPLVTQDSNGNRVYYESGDYQYSYVGEEKGIRLQGFSKNSALKKAKKVCLPSELDGYPVTRIAINAFYRNRYLEEVKIPDSVEIIGQDAFFGCRALKKVQLGKKVTTIDIDAFSACSNLSKVIGGQSVKRMRMRAFSRCLSLQKILQSNASLVECQGYEYASSGVRNIKISKNMRVSCGMFQNCKKLKSVVWKYHDKKWWTESLFQNCTSLRKVVLPQNMAYIDEKMFMNCKKLTTITVPAKTKWIGAKAFKNCKSLKTIKLPRSIKKIDKTAFAGCKKLTVLVEKGSYAHEFAKKNHIKYQVV